MIINVLILIAVVICAAVIVRYWGRSGPVGRVFLGLALLAGIASVVLVLGEWT